MAALCVVLVLVGQQVALPAAARPGSPARPVTPTQQGTSPSRGSGKVTTASTTANRRIHGKHRDAAVPAGATATRELRRHPARRSTSGTRNHRATRLSAPAATHRHGFDPASSVEVRRLETPTTKVYANADGTMTATVAASSATQSDTSSTFVENRHPGNHASAGYLYVGYDDASKLDEYRSFVQLPSLSYSTTSPGPLQNAYVLSATLSLDLVISSVTQADSSCVGTAVDATPVTSSWSAGTLNTFPGPALRNTGPTTYSKFSGKGTGVGKNCPKSGATYGAPTIVKVPVTRAVQGWVHGWLPNNGLALTSDGGNFTEFSTTGANKPTMTITYVPYGDGANYAETDYVAPVNNQRGAATVTVANEGASTWTPSNGYKLDYELFKISGTTRTAVTSPASIPAVMPKTVAPGQKVEVTPQLPALPPATYAVCWDMRDTTHNTTFSALGVPVTCYSFVVQNNPPVFDSFSPDNNALEYTLTPTLSATAHDPDHYPANATLTYAFQLYNLPGTLIASKAASAVASYTVPAKTLTFGNLYYWRVQVSDSTTASPWSDPIYFTVPSAQQPLITSHLGAAPYDATVKGVDPSVGNYSTVETDASVPDIPDDPGVAITRTYNSLDPRLGNFFGSGWSTVLDMRAQPDTDGTGSILITLADGRQERFALNPDGTYGAPLGVKSWLQPISGGGFRLIDGSHKQFTFTQSAQDPVTGQQYWGLTAEGAAETQSLVTVSWRSVDLTAPDGSTRSFVVPLGLRATGATAAGLGFAYDAHTITTDTGTTVLLAQVRTVSFVAPGGGAGPAQTWSYGYDGGGLLSSVCPPTSPTNCTSYSYSTGASSGSHFASMVTDSNPRNYYRLADAAGSTSAADAMVSHEGTTDAVPHNVTFGSDGHLPGSPVTSASFDGASSYVALPNNLLAGDYLSFGMWFQTTGTGQTLFGNENVAPGGTAATGWVPAAYIGTDGKLHASLWDGSRATSDSLRPVNDGAWHYMALSVAGTTQTLYVDGVASAPRNGAVLSHTTLRSGYSLGAGKLTTASPSAPNSDQGWFQGRISDFWYAQHPIGLPQVQQEFGAGITSARELIRTSLPSGKQGVALTYDAAADRVRTVTGSDGGTWTLPPSTTRGSPGYYDGELASTQPYIAYGLGETTGSTAADSAVSLDPDSADDATYNDVVHNPSGLFGSDGPGSASFNGTTSYINLPKFAFPILRFTPTLSMWIRTTKPGGTLFGMQNAPFGSTPTETLPVLYIGTDGKVHGGYYNGQSSTHGQLPVVSKSVVTDGKWHMITLASGQQQFQDDVDHNKDERLYVDGVLESNGGSLRPGIPGIYLNADMGYSQIGVGSSMSFPASDSATNAGGYFQGDIAAATIWNFNLPEDYPNSVPALFKSRGSATGLTPTTVQQVQDPAGGTSEYQFDPAAGNRTIAYTDAAGGTMRFAYDDHGFQSGVTDANHHTVSYRRDALGDIVWTRRCFSDASCATSTATYDTTVSATAYASGKLLRYVDPLGNATTHTYDPATGLESKTTAPVTAEFPNGRSTTYAYTTTGTATADGAAGVPDLPASTSGPRGTTERYTYYSSGQLASATNVAGARTTYSYDPSAYGMTARTEYSSAYPNGVVTRYTYDSQNRILTQTDPATTDAVTGVVHTRRTTYERDVDGNVTSTTVSDLTGGDTARTTRYSYTDGNRVASVTDPNGNTTGYTYDSVGNQTTATRPDGTVLSYSYTPRNQLKAVELRDWVADPAHPDDRTTLTLQTRAYDPAGRLGQVTDSMGRTTLYEYNNDDTLVGVIHSTYSLDQVFEAYDRDANSQIVQEQTGCTGLSGGCLHRREYSYDAAGFVSQNVDDASFIIVNNTLVPVFRDKQTYTHDADGNVLSDNETAGWEAGAPTRKVTYAYDALGDNTQQTETNGSTTLVTKQGFDTLGRLTSSTDANGHVTTVVNSTQGQPETTQLPVVTAERFGSPPASVQPQVSIGYDTFGEVAETEDQNGNVTQNGYDGNGNVRVQRQAQYTEPSTNTSTTPSTSFEYDSLNRMTATTDPANRRTTVTYDQLGNPVSTTQPGDLTTRATFDTDGERLSQTSPTGARHESTYDGLGRRITDTDVVRQATATAITTGYKYDALGRQIEVDEPIGKRQSTFDGLGEQLTSTDARGNVTTYAYGLPGQVTLTTAPDKTATKRTYDQAGRLTAEAQLDTAAKAVRTTGYGYDGVGNLTSTTDPQGNATTYAYDAGDRLVRQSQPSSATTSLVSTFGYDAVGNRTRFTNPNGQATNYTFNSWNLPESTIAPAVAGDTALADRATTTTYDVLARGKLTTRPGGVSLADTYDTAGRLTGQTGSGAEARTDDRSFGYDDDGRLTSASSPRGAESFTYDDRGLMLTAAGGGGNSSFGYNAAGWITSRTDDAGTANFTYDLNGNLSTQTGPTSGYTASYTYDTVDEPTRINYGSTVGSRTFTYSPTHQVASDSTAGPTGTSLRAATYTYNAAGQQTGQTVKVPARNYTATSTSAYDPAGRLASWSNGSINAKYAYDGDGNLLTDGTTTATYNERDQIISQTAGSQTTQLTYSPRGTIASSTTGSSTTAATYDAFDQQITNGANSYSYDALGRLSTATEGASQYAFTYDGASTAVTADGQQKFGRDDSGQLTSVQTAANAGGAVLANTHGDTVATLDSSGISGMAAYAPGGKALTSAGILADLGFQGDWTDPATSSVRTASRWYSTATGSFTSADSQTNDPLPAVHANPYAYGDADPLNNSDTSGHDACRAYQDKVVAQQRREAAERAAQARQLQAWAEYALRQRAEFAAERAATIAAGQADQARRLAGLSNVFDEIARDNARSAAAARRQARALKQWYRDHPSRGYAGGRVGAIAFLGDLYGALDQVNANVARALGGRGLLADLLEGGADVAERFIGGLAFASSGGCLSEKPQEDGEEDSGEKDAPRGAPNRRDDNDPLYDQAGEGPTREENPQTVEGAKPGEAEEDPLGSGNTATGGTRDEETPPAVDDNPAEPETEPGRDDQDEVGGSKDRLSSNGRCRDGVGIPLGFGSAEEFAQFGAQLHDGLSQSGFGGTRALLQGSSVTGRSFKTGVPFDVGRTSDFDVALGGENIFNAARNAGVRVRGGGIRTGPLSAADAERLGLTDLRAGLSNSAGRPVNFMIYQNAEDAISRTASSEIPC